MNLHGQQEIEKTAELRKLEMRQLLERQKLKDEIEIAKSEERHAAEDERLLYIDEKLYNYADFSKPTEAPKFEYYIICRPNLREQKDSLTLLTRNEVYKTILSSTIGRETQGRISPAGYRAIPRWAPARWAPRLRAVMQYASRY